MLVDTRFFNGSGPTPAFLEGEFSPVGDEIFEKEGMVGHERNKGKLRNKTKSTKY